MRKVISFFPLIVITLIMVGCDRELTVNLRQSGTLTGYVLDENNVGIKDASFNIGYYGEYALEEMTTDESGATEQIKLLQGQYVCSTSVEQGKLVYRDSKSVQVITEENTRVELRPFENVGNLNISVNSYYDYDIAGLNLAILDYKYDFYELAECIENAAFTKKIDSTGKVRFENLPQGYYYLVIYNDSKNWYDRDGGIRIYKNEDTNYTMYVHYWE